MRNPHDAARVKDPTSWPLLILPVKKPNPEGGPPLLGVIVPSSLTRVYRANLYQLTHAHVSSQMKGFSFVDFDSVEDLVAEWEID